MSVFLPKKKKTGVGQRVASTARPARPTISSSGNIDTNGSSSQSGPSRLPASASPAGSPAINTGASSPSEALPPGHDPSKIIELPLFSNGDLNNTRYNIMRMNVAQEIDPRSIPGPILMNRKPRGGPAMPTVAVDEEGNVVGKYVYDNAGKPVLDAEGQHVVEKILTRDHNLVGGEDGRQKKRGKQIREIFHGDIESVKVRREEADPWVLESGRQKDGVKSEPGSNVKSENGWNDQHKIADKWVGTMIQPGNMSTVLFLDSGAGGFNVVPLNRSYKFDPSRPFTPLDPDAAQKAFEYQAKHKFQNRWEFRQGGPTTAADAVNRLVDLRQEARMQRLEHHMRLHNGQDRKPQIKVERFEDDARREGRQTERGMEGGEDEELDYDFNEEFQDDEDNNTFHRNEEEEEEQKRIEERLKKEFKLANANVGDRPQIEDADDDDSDDDLFGEKLNDQGRKLRKLMRKRGERPDTQYGTDSDSGSDSETESVKSKKEEKKEDKDVDAARSAPGSAERPKKPISRDFARDRASSPSARRQGQPSSGKAQTAPPGSGAAFVAKRATHGASSPRRVRTGSPSSGRAQSPDNGSVRGSSPVSRGGSPAPGREGSPVAVPAAKPNKGGTTGKMPRKTPTESPQPSPSGAGISSPGLMGNKRKNSPGEDPSRPKKTKRPGSSTPTPQPEEVEPFPGMITRTELYDWFKAQNRELVPMNEVIQEFKSRLSSVPKEKMGINQKLFLTYVKGMTKQESKMLRFHG